MKNINDACGEEPTYKGVLSTYIHELFHAFFHYVTEQKQAEYNYIREIEEAMADKHAINSILYGDNVEVLPMLEDYCRTEQLDNGITRKRIGF